MSAQAHVPYPHEREDRPLASHSAVADRAPTLARARRRMWLAAGASLVVVALLCGVTLARSGRGSAGCDAALLPCGARAPDFTARSVPGLQPITLSTYHGRPVLLEYFATPCTHCQHTAPYLERLDAANRRRGLVVLSVQAINLDHRGHRPTSPADVAWFVGTFHVGHPVLYDPGISTSRGLGPIATRYRVSLTPTLYLLDRAHVIRWSYSGPIGDPAADVGAITQAAVQAQIDRVVR